MASNPATGKEEHIVVAGAGSIGCFIGGLLLAAGRRVTFLGRPRIAEELARFGLRCTDFAGLDIRLPPERIAFTTDPEILRNADLILLTVKSGDTSAAAQEIAAISRADVPLVSLQNGVENIGALEAHLGQDRVLGGMVAFNVVHMGEGRFHRGTSGQVVIEAGHPGVLAMLSVPGLDVAATSDIAGVQWGKLLLNLNNALNALSGLPLRQQLEKREWRRLLADQIAEALKVLAAAKIKPIPAAKVPMRFIPPILRLPDSLFRLAAKSMLKIDPEARSSMWEDLTRRRATEVDHLQGAIIRLAGRHGLSAPLSAKISALIKRAEAAKAGPPGLSPQDVRL
jgi:2-dehydropantoate 2-reductase